MPHKRIFINKWLMVTLIALSFAISFVLNAPFKTKNGSYLPYCTGNYIGSVVQMKNGTLTHDERWSGEVLVTDDIGVPEGVTLTIDPGTVVKFKHYRGYKEPWRKIGLYVGGGTIRAVGTPDAQIWFTSDADPPINGDWSGIIIRNSTGSVFNYTIIEFGISGIHQFESEVKVSHSIVRWVNNEGLYAEYSKPVFAYNTLYGNGYHEIALEQFNDAQILYNVFSNGHFPIHIENTIAHIEGNYFTNYTSEVISAGYYSNITIRANKFNQSINPLIIAIDATSNARIEGNDIGNDTVPLPPIDYQDNRNYNLSYIPGDPQDEYLYVFAEEDETRRVIKKIGAGLSFGFGLTYANGSLWRFDIWTEIEEGHFVKMDPITGNYTKFKIPEVLNCRGLTWDGEYFFAYDHSKLQIYKFKVKGNSTEIVDFFDIPEKEKGGTHGLATDGEFLYMHSRDGTTMFKLLKNGTKVDEIYLPDNGIECIIGPIVWTGTHFWAIGGACGRICKLTADWRFVGEIYHAAGGTWGLAWDGTYLWTLQQTCEMWQDRKVYQIEILISTTTNYSVQLDGNLYHISILSKSSDYNFLFNQSQRKISFNITGPNGTRGYCNITIPVSLFEGPFTVLLDGAPISYNLTQNMTHTSLYFEYTHSAHIIQIFETTISEIPFITITFLLITLALISLITSEKAPWLDPYTHL